MTPKMFLARSTGKVSAAAFLAQYREYLLTGKLAELTMPILQKLDKGEVMPTPALNEIRSIVAAHEAELIAEVNNKKVGKQKEKEEKEKAKVALKEATAAFKAVLPEATSALTVVEVSEGATEIVVNDIDSGENQSYIATIFDDSGNIVVRVKDDGKEEILQKKFKLYQEAERWVDRRLIENGSECHGEVSHTSMCDKNGLPLTTSIDRVSSMGRLFRAKRSPMMKAHQKPSGKLSFGVKVREDHFHFSHG